MIGSTRRTASDCRSLESSNKTRRRSSTFVRGAGAPVLVVPSWQLLGGAGIRLGGDYIELLRQIHRCGSLRQAAIECRISYRTAWTRVGELNALAGMPLVLSVNGGAHGGESVLSEAGQRLLDTHEKARVLFQAALDRGGIDPVMAGSWVNFLRRISMKTSARNQLRGTVTTIRTGSVNADVDVSLPGGSVISAQITMKSLRDLGLEPGCDVWALIKSSWVGIATGPEPAVSSGNHLGGVVVGIVRGSVNAEIELAIRGGDRIVAITSLAAIDEMNIQRGARAWAVFDETSVILGTLG